jgi:hypothetical protein
MTLLVGLIGVNVTGFSTDSSTVSIKARVKTNPPEIVSNQQRRIEISPQISPPPSN